MSPRYVLAVDNGTQSTKVHVVDDAGTVHASAQRPLRATESPREGWVVHPDDDLWDSVGAACREALEAFAGSPGDIEAVGLCTIRYCRALLRADGTLAEPVLSWMDERVSRPHEDRQDVAWVTTSSGYLTHRLTGRFRDSAANCRGPWPVDMGTINWSGDAAAYTATGMPREKLFELVQPGDLLGTVSRDAAVVTGLPEGVPVYATANDKAVEALGAGVDGATVLLSLGTYIAAMTAGAGPPGDDDAVWVNFAAEPGRYLYESNGIRRGMWTVSWAADLVYPRECRTPERPAEDVLGAEAEAAPAGCGGLMAVLDWLAPPEAAFRRGALLGFDGSQRRGHVFRAVLEGIALTMADHVEAMERALGRDPGTVVVSGGGAKSDLMLQVLADVLSRPVRRTGLDDAAGLGAAICACVGHGIHPDVDTARRAMVRPGATVDPDPAGVEAYAAVRRRHRMARRETERLAAALAALDDPSAAASGSG